MKLAPLFAACFLSTFACVLASETVQGPISETSFQTPPDSAKTWTWWHRLNGMITKEGITADLEAMKRGGLGGAQMFDVSGGFKWTGPYSYMSPEWLEMTKFAGTEAARLGLKLGMHNSSGWSSSGGPWVPPKDSMQVLVSSESRATGPSKFNAVLPQPAVHLDFYEDSAVVAFPLVGNKNPSFSEMPPKITASDAGCDTKALFDNDEKTKGRFPVPTEQVPQYVQLEFPKPYTAQAVSLDAGNQGMYGEVQCSKDGQTYEKIREFYIRGARGRRSFSFPPVTAQYFRIVLTKPDRAYYASLDFSEMELSSEALIDDWEQKAGYQPYPKDKKAKTQVVSADDVIPAGRVVDLTSKMKPDGRIEWEVPEGKWVILRIGHTPLGTEGNHNNPASFGGEGLEVDKFDPDAVRRFWAGGPAKVIAALGPLAGTTLTDMVIDSYERGQQQWTAKFPEEFAKRRGYSLVPFYPALTGRIVGSVEQTERFLWDVRRTIGDLFAENYAGTMAKLAHENHLILDVEPAGFIAEQLLYLGQADMPISVAWITFDSPNTVGPASAAHIYGKQLVGGEVMTAQPKDDSWALDPFAVKGLGDACFASGVNRFLFHTFAHQPWPGRIGPGMTAGQWGSHFDRNNTWWEQGTDWRIYLARCQYLLQQGYSVADGLAYCGESLPVGFPLAEGKTRGYKYDAVNSDVILNGITVKDGKLVLKTGAAYAYLNLSDVTEMTVPVLKKIKQLVLDGAVLIGDRTVKTPSLQGYPQCDAEIKALAAELWGDASNEEKLERKVGKGTVFQNFSVDEVFKKLNVVPDLSYTGSKADIRFIHRRTPDADIYFLTNQAKDYVQIQGTFRIDGKVPELWRADTGKTEIAPVYRAENGLTTLPLSFAPKGSIFVIFRNAKANPNHLVAVTGKDAPAGSEPTFSVSNQPDGQTAIKALEAGTFDFQRADGKKQQLVVDSVPAPVDVTGSWNVTFPPNLGAPPQITLEKLISWTDHSDAGVRYFSGSAIYSKTLVLPAGMFGDGRFLYLDLGEVKNLARVKLNGKDLGIAWKPPYRVEVTGAAKPGDNALEVELTNLWPNRLIGDEQLPPDAEWDKKSGINSGGVLQIPEWFTKGEKSPTGRIAFTTWHHWSKDDKLLPSGLLGPVRVLAAQSAVIP